MKISRLVLAALMTLGLAAPVSADDTVSVNGSTTVLPVIQVTAEAYMAANPDIAISISGGGSGNGIKALIDGLCDIAMSSRDIKESEVLLASEAGVIPTRVTVAIDALVPVVHPENPVTDLSTEQLRSIYNGEVNNWEEFGGEDERIVVISRDTSSGTYETWQEKILGEDRVAPSALLQASSGAVVQAVASNPNAIGYIGYGYVDSSTKVLHVNSLEATPETALSGSWPIARDLFLFTNGEPAGAARGFMDYVLSPEGQEFVKSVGFIPLD